MPDPVVVDGHQGSLVTLARLALPAVPVVNRLPGVRKSDAPFEGLTYARRGAVVERGHVERYAAVCGFPRRDTAPLTYPHLLAFPLHAAIMADRSFPWPAIGLVHVDNSVTSRRPVAVGEQLDLEVSVGAPRPHAKGSLLDFRTVATADDEPVWASTSTYLRRGPATPGVAEGGGDAAYATPSDPTRGVAWDLPADLGRRYAAVSGDRNPIHLYPLTARALGFRRQIVHGMWSKARCVAALDNRLPSAVRVDVSFRRPVFLPGRVTFAHEQVDAGQVFSLADPRSGSLHLLGRARPLDD